MTSTAIPQNDGHVGEEHGHRAGEQANEREADHVDARALGMLVRQVLGQDRDEEHRDDADTEEDAPIDKGHVAGKEDAQSRGDTEHGDEHAVPDDSLLLLDVLGDEHQEDGAGDLPACGLHGTGGDDDPDAQVAEAAEDRTEHEHDRAENHHLLQGHEVTERTVDHAHDAEHDARNRGDQRGEVGLAELVADVHIDHAESLLLQHAHGEDDQYDRNGDLCHLVHTGKLFGALLRHRDTVRLLLDSGFCHGDSFLLV